MKNILLGSISVLVFLPQMSFGAIQPPVVVNAPSFVNPQQAACNQQLNAKSVAFFQQQGHERGAFITANADLIAKQDKRGKWLMIHKNDPSYKNSGTANNPPKTPYELTAQEESTFAAFVAKQQSDKVAFLQQQTQAMQNCLNGTTSPAGT